MADNPKHPVVVALAGTTISAPDIQPLKNIFTDYFDWEVISEGQISPIEESVWGIKPGSAGTKFCVVRAPDATRGMVRIVQGRTRERRRPVAARWAGVEIIVSRDIDGLYERMKPCKDFKAFRDPITMDWSDFGSNQHRAFLGIAPGGTHLALTMGLTQPKGRAFPKAQAWVGHVFDVPLMTSRFERSARFYRDVVGMTPILTSQFNNNKFSWHDLFNLPHSADVALDIIKGDAPDTGLGGIEMQGYDESLIDTDQAVPDLFDGGACMLTYTTKNIDEAFAAISASPLAQILSKPQALKSAPYNGTKSFIFLGPDQERFEICEELWSAR
ncbi:MAG: hypothetical protein JNM81_07115 [Rhodospirillaceae bacterium]|nr:hypothetical protein [Rhodospirillaceae bacterium]